MLMLVFLRCFVFFSASQQRDGQGPYCGLLRLILLYSLCVNVNVIDPVLLVVSKLYTGPS